MPDKPFPHLHLIKKSEGRARLSGGGNQDSRVKKNQSQRDTHGKSLRDGFSAVSKNQEALHERREQEGRPQISAGIPFLLQIPAEDDGTLEFISEKLGLELVAEYDDGYLIVSSQNLDLKKVIDLANDFANKVHGSGKMANIVSLDPNPLSTDRIQRILDEGLVAQWPFNDTDEFILDISIEVAPFNTPKSTPPGLKANTEPQKKAELEAAYEEYKQKFWEYWDTETIRRQDEIQDFVAHYEGEILRITDDSAVVEFPDSFSMRVRMSGEGFKDLIGNYPNIFEVLIPDNIEQFSGDKLIGEGEVSNFTLEPPDSEAPAICVIDSGIQEKHRWLENAILEGGSLCFIPGKQPDDVADYVQGGGHGTRVAGACLYSDTIPTHGEHQAPFWILNARVLDEHNNLINAIFPADLIQIIVHRYQKKYATRLFQHSIAANRACRTQRMSIWATAIDLLSYRDDALLFQATGNLPTRGAVNAPGILDHLTSDRSYPKYLFEDSSRIANPAQSLQALTVGSISREFFNDGNRKSFGRAQYPSAFTRTGFGLWHSIKPEVVEFGGDYAVDQANPPTASTPQQLCPDLLRSTMHGGPAYAADTVGTSYATPKVAHIGGHLEALFPEQCSLLYRGLIVNSARWPEWAEEKKISERPNITRAIGYGVPDLERATQNNENRVTLITDSTHEVKAYQAYIFGVPIPPEIRPQGDSFKVRIDVTLSYVAEPRRTRKSRRGYLGVWLDWISSKKGEDFSTFENRALVSDNRDDSDDGNFRWVLGNGKNKNGETDGVSRKNGTVQKDWTIVDSYELTDMFGIAVRGHPGWARRNLEATAKFALVVSFQALGAGVKIYEYIDVAVRQEIEAESKSSVEVST